MRQIPLTLLACTAAALLLNACSATSNPEPLNPQAESIANTAPVEFPAQLPADALQPWETGRRALALDVQSEFTTGTQRFLEGGSVTDAGAASRIGDSSGSADAVSYAIYRLPMGGFQPGALALDANVLPAADGSPSRYYLGLSSYADGRWEWHGPYSEHHVRLARSERRGPDVFASADYTSEFDNLFVCVLVSGAAQVELLGITSDSLSGADGSPPPVPQGLTATPAAGAVLLEWQAVAAADLAGYRVHYSTAPFISPNAVGVQHAGFVEGSTRHLLHSSADRLHLRVSAVDNNGNESAASELVNVSPLPGPPLQLGLGLSNNSVPRNALASITVEGGEAGLLHDYDLDGDGIPELTDQSQTQQNLPTQQPGLLRPAVIAHDAGMERIALGGVSLLVTANSPPVAYGTADVQSGSAPLSVSFDGTESTDFDGSIVGGGWDFDGDGIFDAYDESSTSQLTASHEYSLPGFYNARLRVIDGEGAWDVDTVGIFVDGGNVQDLAPVASLQLSQPQVILGINGSPLAMVFDASDSFDPEGGALEYSFDILNNGNFSAFDSEPTAFRTSFSQGLAACRVRVRDEAGNIASDLAYYPVYQFNSQRIVSGVQVDNRVAIAALRGSLSNNRFGIAYYDAANDDLMFCFSGDLNGYSWSAPYVVDPLGGEWMELFQEEQNFQLAWYRDGDLFYAESADDGQSFGPTRNVDIGADDAGLFVSGGDALGRPALAYYNATDGDLYYCVSSDTTGVAWEVPVNVDGTGNTGLYPDMLDAAARMHIAYYREDTGNLMFASSSDFLGMSWNPPVIVDASAADVGRLPSLVRAGFTFAIAYVDAGNDVWFVTSADPDGLTWNEPLYLGNVTARSCEMKYLDDRYVIFIGDDFFGRGQFIISEDSTGSSWGSWEYYDSGDSTAFMSATVAVNGMPALAYWDEENELYFTTPRLD
ncbi:MAG: PKD domain-containing protein [bacterium]